MRHGMLSGLERLAAVTALLQRIRVEAPKSGVWEAADPQWWWRRPRATDEIQTPVWFDDDGLPVAAALLTDSTQAWSLDLIRLPGLTLPFDDLARPALAQLDQREATVEALVPVDDLELAAFYEEHGFAREDDVWSGWMPASDRPAVAALPAGYRLVDRAGRGTPPHPMAGRNGPDVEARLRQTTLYDPRCDLAVLAPDDTVAGYALFWPDPLTGVGLVEPVRVEDAHAGRGIGYAMISAGLDRLAGAGATTLKIGWESERAGELYTRLGFTDLQTLATYRRDVT
ncbi:GNAT family N-acetyltransferase [Asanoa sp. WMMD1127]|uniref:GNAT family N-acetyltransferase n=1 Tax=Asanoa sp. WMMD1127 TaxID=3016107 RepID=UPI0024175BE9|nr:GNAT family N-acetyltransferase [Asanoa sp. WMMD1127]MDG4827675.1 GNAT family N-acetyltransferase [Asanoa sp. WMMD1127]